MERHELSGREESVVVLGLTTGLMVASQATIRGGLRIEMIISVFK